jgi:hypothetical protein
MSDFKISCNEKGIGKALSSGEYIDLSEDVLIFPAIKKHLETLLEIQEEIFEELDIEEVKKQAYLIDFNWIKTNSKNFIQK